MLLMGTSFGDSQATTILCTLTACVDSFIVQKSSPKKTVETLFTYVNVKGF